MGEGLSSTMFECQLRPEFSPSLRLPPYPESSSSIDTRRAAASEVDPDPTVIYPGRALAWSGTKAFGGPVLADPAPRELEEEESSGGREFWVF